MRITKINIPKDLGLQNGIENIKMDRLAKIVVLAGKNGSGKSRILQKISQLITEKPTKNTIESQQNQIQSLENQIERNKGIISVHQEQKLQTHNLGRESEFESVIQQLHLENTNTERQLSYTKNSIWSYVETSEESELGFKLVPYVPLTNLSPVNQYNKNDQIAQAKSLDNVGISGSGNAPLKIQVVQNEWWEATHQHSTLSDEIKNKKIAAYNKLKDFIGKFIGAKLDRDSQGNATIFDFPLENAQLSEGQKILLQFCISIYSQETELKDLILLMDEPENHLHPSAIIETIDRISEHLENGQIWIATHSVPLLAHFDPSSLWFVEANKVSYAGNIPEKVLESLLGDDDEIAKLQDFIGLPAQLAMNRYAHECLFEPSVVMTGKDDIQTLQIRKQLGNFEKDGKVKILDYGAGKGRLLANIIENFNEKNIKFTDKFEYVAFDKFNNDKADCEALLGNIYDIPTDYYFNDFDTLLSNHDKESFDIVVMCNVLHEIEQKEWINLFSKNGQVTNLLNDNGVLLLVEDTQIPVGEKAYQNGFIVFNTPQIKELFNMKQEEFRFIDDAKNDNRLKCHGIPKDCLSRISHESKVKALQSLQEIAKDKITELRNNDKNYKNGKLHGFWVQQFANTSLALSELTS
jgi:predicted ATPase/SAM-dependent methyltransferase